MSKVSGGGVAVVDSAEGFEQLVDRLSRATAIALDVEGNGLHAYKASLCTVQLAWSSEGTSGIDVAILDTLRAPISLLDAVLGERGPLKILHDLTFDAQLLAAAGVRLGNVRDTSVCARFLGIQALGLANLLQSELGVHVEKGLQRHDWAQRPLTDVQLGYLANDVLHLVALDARLRERADRAGITGEVDDETIYKLDGALAAPSDRPTYLKIKGLVSLEPVQQAVVRRVAIVREEIAAELDVPAFHVASVELLQALALQRPTSIEALRDVRGVTSSRVLESAERWVAAVRGGVDDGALSAEDLSEITPTVLTRAEIDRRRNIEDRLRRWRRNEARAREVDEQVVLPGHCLTSMVQHTPSNADELRAVPGIGACRLARYGEALLAALMG